MCRRFLTITVTGGGGLRKRFASCRRGSSESSERDSVRLCNSSVIEGFRSGLQRVRFAEAARLRSSADQATAPPGSRLRSKPEAQGARSGISDYRASQIRPTPLRAKDSQLVAEVIGGVHSRSQPGAQQEGARKLALQEQEMRRRRTRVRRHRGIALDLDRSFGRPASRPRSRTAPRHTTARRPAALGKH